MDVERELERGVELHRAGELEAAESVYRGVLAECGEDPDALHLLGLVVQERGRLDEAIELLRRAAQAESLPEFECDLARALLVRGLAEEALAAARRACAADEAWADAWMVVGHAHSAMEQ